MEAIEINTIKNEAVKQIHFPEIMYFTICSMCRISSTVRQASSAREKVYLEENFFHMLVYNIVNN